MAVLAACSRFKHWGGQELGRLVERQLAIFSEEDRSRWRSL